MSNTYLLLRQHLQKTAIRCDLFFDRGSQVRARRSRAPAFRDSARVTMLRVE